MKIIFVIFFISISISAQNKIVTDSKTDKPMLFGYCSIDAFQDSSFAWWYNSEFENYEPDEETLNNINERLGSYKIEIILGTWCSDSKREVPRFIKILDMLNYDFNNLTLIAVDRDKNSTDGNIDSKNIELVPTFILINEQGEKGRIVESPVETLEMDLLDILNN
jgi:thiol-disulfide isomerase/thioredoxin